MNYPSGFSLGSACGKFLVDSMFIPVGSDYRRVNFALAGYGYVVPGSLSDPITGTMVHSVQQEATITHSVRPSALITHSVTGA